MCIRDRNQPALFAKDWLAKKLTVPLDIIKEYDIPASVGPKTLFIASSYSGNTCLLYTSDAADERSSVDLGGRRIIKKKKKGEHIVRRNHNTKINKYT